MKLIYSTLHYKNTYGWLCETGGKSDKEFLSIHFFFKLENGVKQGGVYLICILIDY